MSNERDIDDILDSLNQLLREGESHNDDHVEVDVSQEIDKLSKEIDVDLHDLDDEISKSDNESSSSYSQNDETPSKADAELMPEAQDQSDTDQNESEGDHSDGGEEAVDAAVSRQRVVLTEEMLVDNPQGNLLATSLENSSFSAQNQETSEEQEAEQHKQTEQAPAHSPLHIDRKHMELLIDQVTDDVVDQLRHELPIMVKRSLYHHLSHSQDAGKSETDSEQNQENREHD